MSNIEWTDATWNPVTGCTKISPGCKHCYAERMAKRLQAMGQPNYANGFELTLHEHALEIPLRWKKPRMIFVNSMSDLFHKDVPFEFIDRVFAVMALCPQHTFQILTKRPERMAEYLENPPTCFEDLTTDVHIDDISDDENFVWPLPNVWLGTSVENQEQADKRIPHLLRCPAAVRFLSVEPMLGAVDLERWLFYNDMTNDGAKEPGNRLHWVICGGESGPGARPFNIEWARSLKEQCQEAGVPFFLKQLGTKPYNKENVSSDPCCTDYHDVPLNLKSRKGGDMAEWPEDLRVRQMPNTAKQQREKHKEGRV